MNILLNTIVGMRYVFACGWYLFSKMLSVYEINSTIYKYLMKL